MEISIPLPPDVGRVACDVAAPAGREIAVRIHRALTDAGHRCEPPLAVVGGWEFLVDPDERPVCLSVACDCAPGSVDGRFEVRAVYEGVFGESLDGRRRREVITAMGDIEREVRSTFAVPSGADAGAGASPHDRGGAAT